jgi:prepilin-type N-terminal cleavage/methylation domain-containing protein
MNRPPMPPMRRHDHGFTLLELMIVVAIIGILAAVAIPSFMKYIYKARTGEARTHLEKLGAGARTYYLDERYVGTNITPVPRQFPESIGTTPALSCCLQGGKCIAESTQWDDPVWAALHFAVSDPHYFRYEFVSEGIMSEAKFTGRAYGDLDCDGIESTFEIQGEVNYLGNDMTSGGAVARKHELE